MYAVNWGNFPQYAMMLCWGVRSGDELCVICIFDQICKQKIINIPNNTEKLLNSIVSFSAKLIIND